MSLVMSVGSAGPGDGGCTKTGGAVKWVGCSDAMVNVRRALAGVIKRNEGRSCSCEDKLERSVVVWDGGHSRS